MDTVGWDLICTRASQALEAVPGAAVLAGFSMGAGVIGSVWDQRRAAAGLILLHGIAPVPATARPGQPEGRMGFTMRPDWRELVSGRWHEQRSLACGL